MVLSLLSAVLFLISASAQKNVVLVHEYSGFKGVDVSGGYKVSIIKSDTYSVKLIVDELLETYAQAYVRDGILHVTVDSRSFTPELKKALRGRNAISPELKAEIYAPDFNELYLNDNVVLADTDTLRFPSLAINLLDRSSVRSLAVTSNDASLTASKTSSADISFETDSLYIKSSGAASLKIRYKAERICVQAGGTSELSLAGDSGSCHIAAESSGNIASEGTCSTIKINGTGSSRVCSKSVSSAAEVTLSGSSRCFVGKSGSLKVDLTGSSNLVFDGNPSVEVVRIISSSMSRPGDTYNKRAL